MEELKIPTIQNIVVNFNISEIKQIKLKPTARELEKYFQQVTAEFESQASDTHAKNPASPTNTTPAG
ncbi:MAG: hypothetical protein LBS74_11180 [Oscillospiraceae bacterium]|nr:hypothetical protein [Oscillospiraceae bacterium]